MISQRIRQYGSQLRYPISDGKNPVIDSFVDKYGEIVSGRVVEEDEEFAIEGWEGLEDGF